MPLSQPVATLSISAWAYDIPIATKMSTAIKRRMQPPNVLGNRSPERRSRGRYPQAQLAGVSVLVGGLALVVNSVRATGILSFPFFLRLTLSENPNCVASNKLVVRDIHPI